MKLSRQEMYERATARDAAYDGRFLMGVLSTGIYCLPSCPARDPKIENVDFFEAPPEAEAVGLRPCRRCRPDLFYAGRDLDLETVDELVEEMRQDPAAYPDVASLAAAANLGVSKLNGLLRKHYHSTPGALLQEARIDQARERLIASSDRVLDVAWDCGFESPSAFHANFRRLTGLSPSAYRRLPAEKRFRIRLPEGFPLASTLRFWGRDSKSPTERVESSVQGSSTAVRAIVADGHPYRVEIEFSRGRARCRIESAGALSPQVAMEIHRQVTRSLGLLSDPAPFEARAAREADIARLVSNDTGLRIPQTPTVFEGLVWAIVGQQVNLAFAYRLRKQVIELAGQRLGPWLIGHPTASAVAELGYRDLIERQFSRRKAEYLIDVARHICEHEWEVENLPAGSFTRLQHDLLSLRGIGPWSSAYVAMRACGFEDCVPIGDPGLARGIQDFFGLADKPSKKEVERRMKPFAPHRSLATFHLWNRLGGPA